MNDLMKNQRLMDEYISHGKQHWASVMAIRTFINSQMSNFGCIYGLNMYKSKQSLQHFTFEKTEKGWKKTMLCWFPGWQSISNQHADFRADEIKMACFGFIPNDLVISKLFMDVEPLLSEISCDHFYAASSNTGIALILLLTALKYWFILFFLSTNRLEVKWLHQNLGN